MFKLYLIENTEETLIKASEDPLEIHHIATGRSMRKRLSRVGNSIRVSDGTKNIAVDKLERICLDCWFIQAEQEMQA